jgi:hypothetical protein
MNKKVDKEQTIHQKKEETGLGVFVYNLSLVFLYVLFCNFLYIFVPLPERRSNMLDLSAPKCWLFADTKNTFLHTCANFICFITHLQISCYQDNITSWNTTGM